VAEVRCRREVTVETASGSTPASAYGGGRGAGVTTTQRRQRVGPDAPSSDQSIEPSTRHGWRLLRITLAQQRRGLAAGIAVGLLWSVGKVVVPRLTRLAIDRGLLPESSEQRADLWFWAGLIAVAAVIAGIFAGWRRWLAFRESRLTETLLREQLFAHILRLHPGYHDHAQTGQLMSRASSDLMQVQGFVVMIPLTVSNLAMVVAVVAMLLTSQPWLALVALAPLPFVNVLAQRFNRRIHPAVLAVQAEQGQMATIVEESVTGVRVVKGFGAEPVQAAKLEAKADDIRRVALGAARVRSSFLPALDLLPNLGLIAVLGIGGHQVVNEQMSYGQLIEFLQYIALLIWPLRNLGMTVAFGQRAAAALLRIDDVLSTAPAIVDPAQPVALRAATSAGPIDDTARVGAVRFSAVGFHYDGAPAANTSAAGDSQCPPLVLDGFDLDIPAGASVALVGETGSGKTTVARLLTRFYDVTAGAVSIDDVDVRDLRVSELRRAVGIVFEDTLLFNDSVRGNIAFAQPDADLDTVRRAARLAGADEFISELPQGYNTVVGERGYSLSGGQRQRIAIARAIVADPRVLILDDATSAVDPSKEHEIRSAMTTVMRDRTTIVIAHRPGTIALADTVVFLDEGRVTATGSHDDLLSTSARYRAVLAAWADRDDEQDT
jgi:ATP-binding cassette, subfamily B, bacterial